MMNVARRWLFLILAAAVLCAFLPGRDTRADRPVPVRLTLTVSAGEQADLYSRLDIDSRSITRAIVRAKKERVPEPSVLPDVTVRIQAGSGAEQRYRLEPSGHLWNESAGERLVLPDAAAIRLLSYAEGLRSRHYGKLVDWDEANKLIPRKSYFSITDLESGLTFRVQRRAGSDHADVQPLTKEDTRIMKRIYDNHWSWRRRAILVRNASGLFAASMNGMPHGGDGIPGNNFSGHFCVHFYRSTTHKSDTPDLEHQLMVHKAAGLVRSFLDAAAPDVLAESFVTAMAYKDAELIRQAGAGLDQAKLREWLDRMEEVQSIRIVKPLKEEQDARPRSAGDADKKSSLTAEVQTQIAVQRKGGKNCRTAYAFSYARESADAPWRLKDIVIAETSRS